MGILIGKGKLLLPGCSGESRCRDSFFYRIGKSDWQVCRKGQLPVFVCCLFLNDGSRFHNNFAVLVGDVLLCTQGKNRTLQYTVRILLLFQHGHFHLLAVVLPVKGIGHLCRMLVTVGQVNLSDFPVQHITFRCLLFLHIIFSKRQVPQACNPGIIRGDLCDHLVLFIVVCAFPVSGFDIIQSVHFKGDVLQGTGHIFKQVGNPSADRIQCGNILQKFPFFVNQEKPFRDSIFHLHLLDFCRILHGKRNLLRLQVAIRGQFLTQRISLAHYQPLDEMFLTLHGFPCVYHISILIKHGQRCAGKLHPRSQVCFLHGNHGRLILKLRCQFHHLHILPLIRSGYLHHFTRRNIASRGF